MFESIGVGETPRPAALIFAKFQDADLPKAVAAIDSDGLLAAAMKRNEFTGAIGNSVEAFLPAEGKNAKPTRVIIVGLGKKAAFKVGDIRDAVAAAARKLSSAKEITARIDLAPALDQLSKAVDPRLAGRCAGEAFGLLAWNSTAFKGKGSEKKDRRPLTISAPGSRFREGLELGLALAESTNLARTLSETPPNIATPDWMAQQAQALAKEHGLAFTVLRGNALQREKLVGLINVGKASENEPCFIRLEYTPAKGRKTAKPVVLIGKTMTYDTGGLSLKINNGMVGMKRDKDGGCAVLGAMHAVATAITPNVPVVALLCAAENSVSNEAYRPDDVLTYRNGVTVEVTNTDAEGRLVLADGLCWACEKEDPAAIIDLATLTGGVVVALGSTYCGMFCDNDRLRRRVQDASDRSGERVWQLPMHNEYREMMKSPIADILNSNANRKAHPIQGAAFLSYFVEGYPDKNVPWCHLDIAGVHATDTDAGPFVKGPVGWGVRLLSDLLAAW